MLTAGGTLCPSFLRLSLPPVHNDLVFSIIPYAFLYHQALSGEVQSAFVVRGAALVRIAR